MRSLYVHYSDPSCEIAQDPGPLLPRPPTPCHGTASSPEVSPHVAGALRDGPKFWSAAPMPHLWAMSEAAGPHPRGVHLGLRKPRQKLCEVAAGPASTVPAAIL